MAGRSSSSPKWIHLSEKNQAEDLPSCLLRVSHHSRLHAHSWGVSELAADSGAVSSHEPHPPRQQAAYWPQQNEHYNAGLVCLKWCLFSPTAKQSCWSFQLLVRNFDFYTWLNTQTVMVFSICVTGSALQEHCHQLFDSPLHVHFSSELLDLRNFKLRSHLWGRVDQTRFWSWCVWLWTTTCFVQLPGHSFIHFLPLPIWQGPSYCV